VYAGPSKSGRFGQLFWRIIRPLTEALAVKSTVFMQTGFYMFADYVQKQSLGGFTEAGG